MKKSVNSYPLKAQTCCSSFTRFMHDKQTGRQKDKQQQKLIFFGGGMKEIVDRVYRTICTHLVILHLHLSQTGC